MIRVNDSFIAKLTQGSGLLLVANVLSKVLAILILPLLTGLLPPALYGEAALAGTLISLASVIALAGMDISYARAFFGDKDITGSQVEAMIWRRGMWHALLAGIVAALAWTAYSRFDSSLHPELAALIALGVFGTLFSALAQVRARLLGHYLRMALGVLFASVLAYGLMYVFALRSSTSAYALVAGSVLLVWVTGLAMQSPGLLRLAANASPADSTASRKVLAVGLPVMLTAPAFWVVSSVDRWFLGATGTTSEVGIYAIGVSFGTLGMMLNSAVLSAWVPEVIREYETNAVDPYKEVGQAKSLLVLAYAMVWMTITVLSPELIGLFVNSRYQGAVDVVPWIAAGVFFYGCAHLFNTVFLLERRLGITALIWSVAVVLSLVCNAWAVPRFGMMGAAMVQCLVFAGVAVMHWLFSRKIKRIHVFNPTLLLQLSVIVLIGWAGYQWHPADIFLAIIVKICILALLLGLMFWSKFRNSDAVNTRQSPT